MENGGDVVGIVQAPRGDQTREQRVEVVMVGCGMTQLGRQSAVGVGVEHVFDLLEEEILAVLDGRRPGSALAALVATRQSQQAEWATTPPPDYFLVGREAASPPPAAMPRAASGATRHGTPVGSGRARGRACRLDRPDQGERLARGDVLVVATTDPAWTPLFLKAGALVMETGGFMSHGAIVAREFGIPAVVNLPGILDEIADGDELEVDGWQGRVTRLGAHT